jgi:hypothetical protein
MFPLPHFASLFILVSIYPPSRGAIDSSIVPLLFTLPRCSQIFFNLHLQLIYHSISKPQSNEITHMKSDIRITIPTTMVHCHQIHLSFNLKAAINLPTSSLFTIASLVIQSQSSDQIADLVRFTCHSISKQRSDRRPHPTYSHPLPEHSASRYYHPLSFV